MKKHLNRLILIGAVSALGLLSTANAQPAFQFNFKDSGAGFNDPTQGATRRSALESAGQSLSQQLPIGRAVTITFDVNSNTTDNDTLASAGSGIVSLDNGFTPSIAHKKVLNGTDGNGDDADGEITWNLFHDWDLDNDIGPDSFDFVSTAMHEILHAIGFSGAIASNGTGYFEETSGTPDAWAPFDKFLVNNSGTRVIDEQFQFRPAELGALAGGSSLFFNGTNALAANNGQPVVIYSPTPWEDGSSANHTDDPTYVDALALLMTSAFDTGPGVRTLSQIELGILKDLGYEFEETTPTEFAYLTNISVRNNVGSDAQTLIAGFAISGGDKSLLIRGVGPTPGDFGVNGSISDPTLGLFSGTTETQSNDNWDTSISSIFQTVGAFALPDNSLDAALVATLTSASYTVKVTGNNGATGIALAEIYDTAFPTTPTGPRLTNISARSQVGTGAEVLVAGFVIGGTGTKNLLIRGVGPTLGNFGVNGSIADPQLTLFRSVDGTSTQVQTNDNWDSATLLATAQRVGAFDLPNSSLDTVCS